MASGMCLVLCLTLLILSISNCSAYNVNLVLPTSTSDAHTYTQWISMAKLAADEVNDRWQPANSLDLGLFPFPEQDSMQAAGYAIQSGQNASTLALIAAGDSNTVDNMASIAKWFSLPVMSFANSNTTLQAGSDLTFVKVLPHASFEVQVLSALLSHYSWTRIGVIYSTNTDQTGVRDAIGAIPGITAINVGLSSDATDFTTQLQAIVRLSINIIVIASSDSQQTMTFLHQASQSNLFTAGRAFIVIAGLGSGPITSIPPGTLVIETLDAITSNITAFTSKIQALDNNVYPGTGNGSTLAPHSILVYDSVHAIARSIEDVARTLSSVTRETVSDAIKSLDYEGVSGRMVFDRSNGFRLYANAQIRVATDNVTLETCMTFTGGDTSLTILFEPTWPGDSDEVPDDEIDIIPIAVIMQFSSLTLPYANMRQVLSYAANQINAASPPLLPPGKKISLLMFEDSMSPSQAIQLTVPLPNYGVVGVLGPVTSSLSIAVQNVISRYNIPQIAPGATNPSLSLKSQYPTFMRTCPPDDVQAAVQIALSKIWGWTDIGIIFSSDAYGVGLQAVVAARATEANINILYQVSIDSATKSYDSELAAMRDAGVRVLFLILAQPKNVIQSMVNIGWKPPAIVGTDTIAQPNYHEVAKAWDVPESFLEGWVTLLPSGGNGPYFDNYMEELRANPPAENGQGVIDLVGSGYFLVASSIDALNVYADAILRLVEAGEDTRNGTSMLNALYSTKKTLLTGLVQFNENGDRIGSYDILNVRNGLPHLTARYDFTSNQLQILDNIIWSDGTTQVPLSTLPRRPAWLKWSSGAAITLAILASLGIVICVLLAVMLYWQRKSKIVTTATWPFLMLILAGAALGYGSMFTWIGRPTPYICGLRIWLPPMAFVLIMAPLLAKTWRLHKIFTLRDLKVAPIPLWRLSLVAGCLVLVQLIICIIWIALGTVQTEFVNDKNDRAVAFVICKLSRANQIASYVTYGYLGFIMVFGTYLAFRVRKLPKDFNESRWIGFSIYNTLLFSGIILILGYTLNNFPVTVLILICVCTLAICTGVIGFMMLPKAWTLILHPEKRSGHSSSARSGSIALKTPGTSYHNHTDDSYDSNTGSKGSKASKSGTSEIPPDGTSPSTSTSEE